MTVQRISPLKIGLVGARGYVGRELIALIEAEPALFALRYATSKTFAGKRVCDVFEGAASTLEFATPDPQALAQTQGLDAIILGMPNGFAPEYVAAIDAANRDVTIIDLSSDHRHLAGWAYGMLDLFAPQIKGAKRIANPGCYATAATLGLYPLKAFLRGTPSIFGVSGYSGAGTTPSDKNDPERLRDNLIPYKFLGHAHQFEVSATLGRPVRFMPHVAAFFRGLSVTIACEVAADVTLDQIKGQFHTAFGATPHINVQDALPEIRQVANTPNVAIGGFALDEATSTLSLNVVLDNLLWGAASQCIENLRLQTL